MKRYSCDDGFCGASDCATCHPEWNPAPENDIDWDFLIDRERDERAERGER